MMGMPPPPPRFDGSGAGEVSKLPPHLPFDGAQQCRRSTGSAEPEGDPEGPLLPKLALPRRYEQPEWGGVSSVDFSLEVLKDGSIIETIDCRGRDHLLFGRTPNNDVVLEHPSSSRLHAVLQFTDSSEDVFIHDCSSTHGTFVNKRRLKPGGAGLRRGPDQVWPIVQGIHRGKSSSCRRRDQPRGTAAARAREDVRAGSYRGAGEGAACKAQAAAAAAGASWGMEDDDTSRKRRGRLTCWALRLAKHQDVHRETQGAAGRSKEGTEDCRHARGD